MTHKYCMEVDKIMNVKKNLKIKNFIQNQDYKKHKIYHYTSTDFKKRSNAAYLMGAYLLICKGKTSDEAWSFFDKVDPQFKPFRDAICGDCSYECTVFIIKLF